MFERFETLVFNGQKTPEGDLVLTHALTGNQFAVTRGRLLSLLEETQPTKPHQADGLEVFKAPSDLQALQFRTREFTCLCPKTGQPDFATIDIRYIPNAFCIESKSLKLYFWSFRDRGAFHEAVTHQILTDLKERLNPRWIQVFADFDIRGGLHENVSEEYTHPSDPDPEGLERLIKAHRISFLAEG